MLIKGVETVNLCCISKPQQQSKRAFGLPPHQAVDDG